MKLNKLPLNVIGLNRVGLNQIGSPSHRANTSDRPYIDPEVLASLVAVCICDGKSNNDPDRAVIKNLVDPDNPFVISNAAYEGMSGCNGYPVVFGENKTYQRVGYGKATSTVMHLTNIYTTQALMFSYIKDAGKLTSLNKDYPSYKIKVSGIKKEFRLRYQYVKNADNTNISVFDIFNDGTYAIPKSVASDGSLTSDNVWVGFIFIGTVPESVDITIEVLPEYEGAFVTDGKDDLITSTKTVKEMLGGSNEVTVVSMIHQIGLSSLTTINNIRSESVAHLVCRNICSSAGKTGIYGYSRQINTNNPPTLINNILGDKKDYTAEGNSALDPTDKFFVQGYKYSGSISEVSPIAYYWTFVSNKVLTTDQINQVISYFNLDKHVKPDIIYDTIRQGITNENHASFNDELVDFSGNGHNMKLYNLNWDKQSGIGSYPFSFKDYNYFSDRADVSVNKSNFVLTANFDGNNFLEINTKNTEVPSFKIKAEGIDTITNGRLAYRIAASDGSISVKYISEDGEYEIPGSPLTENAAHSGFYVSGGINDNVRVKVTIIPDYEGALVSDGIDDYGKVENLPIYKDYTVVADREMLGATDGGVFLKGEDFREGAFSFDYTNESSSFGGSVQKLVDTKRLISYQSKYVNNGININAGTATDTDKLWLAKLGNSNRYSKLALWSFLLFPYSLSEFLLERQLKRYKLGTLYPDMVEFRPIVKSNREYSSISYSVNPGEYISVDSMVTITVTLSNTSDKLIDVSCNAISDISVSGDNGVYKITGKVVKSPQKIAITIDEYIRYEDIVQPYPAIINLKQDGKTITWGDKLKVGSDIVFVGSANLLPELYTVSETRYNGVTLYPNTIIKVEKSMVFDNARTYLKANEPSCILSPNRLRIPNSSYKILGYIPDLTGKGNHGRLNNFAYTEESGANEDGSIRFDGKDDHITIPTIKHGGKCMLMKVNWNKDALMLYDQRRDNNPNSFAIYISNFNNEDSIAYSSRNDGKTYIDGVLNTSVKGSQLKDVTHNITITNSNSNNDNTVSPAIGSNAKYNAFYAQMALFDFMLFPEISSEDEIKELNECVGIEGNVWGTLTQLINSTLISNETLIKNE